MNNIFSTWARHSVRERKWRGGSGEDLLNLNYLCTYPGDCLLKRFFAEDILPNFFDFCFLRGQKCKYFKDSFFSDS